MENNFLCFSCKMKAVQFTILHCDHLICSYCLNNTFKNFNGIAVVQCQCGIKTFSNQNSLKMSLKTPSNYSIDKNLQKTKYIQDSNSQVSNFHILQSQISLNDDTHWKNKENLNTQNLKCTHLNDKVCSKFFLKTQPLNVDRSINLMTGERYPLQMSRKVVKGVKSVQSIKSQSPSQKLSQNESPEKAYKQQRTKHLISRISKQTIGNTTSDPSTCIFVQLQKQLRFISIQFQKQLQTCEKTFKKAVKQINSQFEKIVRLFKKNYLQKDIANQSCEKNSIMLSMAQVVKQKYQSTIGRRINVLREKIADCFVDREMIKGFYNLREKRQTVFLVKDIKDQKTTKSCRKNSAIKSKSKPKQCALYLAISPKNDKDQVVNYIDVIRRDKMKTSKKNLTKKTIKGDKIRIY